MCLATWTVVLYVLATIDSTQYQAGLLVNNQVRLPIYSGNDMRAVRFTDIGHCFPIMCDAEATVRVDMFHANTVTTLFRLSS